MSTALYMAMLFIFSMRWVPWVVGLGVLWFLHDRYFQDAPPWAVGIAVLIVLVGMIAQAGFTAVVDNQRRIANRLKELADNLPTSGGDNRLGW